MFFVVVVVSVAFAQLEMLGMRLPQCDADVISKGYMELAACTG